MPICTTHERLSIPVTESQRDLVIDAFIIAREIREKLLPESVVDPHRRVALQNELQTLTKLEVDYRSSSGNTKLDGPANLICELVSSILVGAAHDFSELVDTLAQTTGELTDEALADLSAAQEQVLLATTPFVKSRNGDDAELPEAGGR